MFKNCRNNQCIGVTYTSYNDVMICNNPRRLSIFLNAKDKNISTIALLIFKYKVGNWNCYDDYLHIDNTSSLNIRE